MGFLGIDIGCSSIKYGLVSLDNEITANKYDLIMASLSHGEDKYFYLLTTILTSNTGYSAVGIGFPGQVWNNKVLRTTFNFEKIWDEVQKFLHSKNIPCFAINDADAAGLAEITRNGAANLRKGVTILLTLGTGIGSAVFLDGKLIPNTELGTLEMNGMLAEQYAAPSVITQSSLSIHEWAARLQEYLMKLEHLLPSNHIVLGGGISEKYNEFAPKLHIRAELMPAYYRNQAGVIGAAIYAAQQAREYIT